MNQNKLACAPENAEKFKDWLANRGGIAFWRSVSLSDPGRTMSTPATHQDGKPATKPHWMMGEKPDRIITDINDVEVVLEKVVKRFHVAVRMGSQGMSFKVTDGGTRRIRAEVAKAGEGAWYQFDYDAYENCVILKPDRVIPLKDFDPTKDMPKTD